MSQRSIGRMPVSVRVKRKWLRAAARANSRPPPRTERRPLRTLPELRNRAAEHVHTIGGEPVDVLLGPTAPCTATWLNGVGEAFGWRAVAVWSRLTRPYSGTGLPAHLRPLRIQVAGTAQRGADRRMVSIQ